MCGIVGLFCKTETHRHELGRLTAVMLREMRDRGPDSAGFAVYDPGIEGRTRITVLAEGREVDRQGALDALARSRPGRRDKQRGVELAAGAEIERARTALAEMAVRLDAGGAKSALGRSGRRPAPDGCGRQDSAHGLGRARRGSRAEHPGGVRGARAVPAPHRAAACSPRAR